MPAKIEPWTTVDKISGKAREVPYTIVRDGNLWRADAFFAWYRTIVIREKTPGEAITAIVEAILDQTESRSQG